MIKIQKKRKFKPKNRKNVKKNDIEKDLLIWVLFTVFYLAMIGYLYGMAEIYYPDPIYMGFSILGFRQYFDIGITIVYGGIAVYSVLLVIFFKRVL